MTGFALISPWDLQQRMRQTPPPRMIDVRDFDEFDTVHLEGARCVPLPQVLKQAGDWKPDEEVILICQSGQRAREAAHRLCDVGFTSVRVVNGGTAACVHEDLPAHRGRKRIPIQRQVFIGAGLVILSGLVLSLFYPAFEIISWFAASMLVVAGISGFCPMAIMLAAAPWNKTTKQDHGGPTACDANGACS